MQAHRDYIPDMCLGNENQHDTVDNSTSKIGLHVRISDGSHLPCTNNWTHTPSAIVQFRSLLITQEH